MSRVHDAMRRLAHETTPETGSSATLSNLVGALIEELADEMPNDPYLEPVRADLLAASRSYEAGDKKDLALRFYLAIRSLLREHAFLHERLRQAEASKMNPAPEFGNFENPSSAAAGQG
jgi:hypothetical protein